MRPLCLLCLLAPLLRGEVITDDFDAPLDARWKADGSWNINEGHAEAAGAYAQLVRMGVAEHDVDISADVTYFSDVPHASAGIQVRVGEGVGYAVGVREIEKGVDPKLGPWERPLLQLFRMQPGGWKLLQEAKVMHCQSGKPFRLRVQCKGPDLFAYFNDMEMPVLREYDPTAVTGSGVALWKDQLGKAEFDHVSIAPATEVPAVSLRTDWSWVRGAVYVRSDAVNAVQMWEDYWDHVDTIDREMTYASVYGFNMLQVYLHWIVWDKHHDEYLKRIEDFLTRAQKHGLKVNFIFWDDCGHVEPSLEFAPPVPGRHNSQMMPNPSHAIRDNPDGLGAYEARFHEYVGSIAKRFKDDSRISFWQIYNEAMGAKESYRTSKTDENIDTLLRWTRQWIKETGTTIPVTATCGGFQGAKYSDFPSYHSYCNEGQTLPNADGGPEHLCTETLNRPSAGIGKIMTDIASKQNGFVVWELMIGRDNCRFPWGHPDGNDEPTIPFHGVIYPDGHPWDPAEVVAMRPGGTTPIPGLFDVTYFKGRFDEELRKSVTPTIDFVLGDESGTGSPDASAGIPKDDFSMRWNGAIVAPETGAFTFHTVGDGEISMKLNEQLLKADGIDSVKLEKGKRYRVSVDYRHQSGDAHLRVSWSGPGMAETALRAVPKETR